MSRPEPGIPQGQSEAGAGSNEPVTGISAAGESDPAQRTTALFLSEDADRAESPPPDLASTLIDVPNPSAAPPTIITDEAGASDSVPPGTASAAVFIDAEARPALGGPASSATVIASDEQLAAAERAERARQSQRAMDVPGYEIQGELGRGGMGVVYRARQVALNRTVALKMILAGGHAGEELLARFRAEAEAVAQLQHPNIVQVYEVGEHGGLPFFSLEFVDGKGLDREIARQPQPPHKAARLIETLARAMHYAHQRGIVHRDLKPANVLLTSDGVPKITDFGLAKRLESDSSQTRTGTIMGTPSYMAPEQGRAEKEIGPLADVYALGSMLYDLLTGRPPFLAPKALETLMQLLHQEPVPPSRLVPKLPRDLETICLKCLQKDPRKRYADAGALAEDLRRFQAGEPVLARPVGRMERSWRWCRRNPRVAVLSAVACVLLLIAGVSLASSAARAAQDRELVAQARVQVSERLEQAADEIRAGNFRRAQDLLGDSNVLVQTNASLADVRSRLLELRGQTELYAEFQRLLDEMHFFGLFGGPENKVKAREACAQFIGLYDELESRSGRGAFGLPPLDATRQQLFQEAVFEAFLVASLVEWELHAEKDEAARRRAAERAVAWLERAEGLLPPTRHLYVRRAFFHGELGDAERKERDLARADEITPTSPVDLFWRAYAERRRAELTQEGAEAVAQHYRKAILHYAEVLQLHPAHFWAYFNWATCQFQLGDLHDALVGFTACIQLNPDAPWPHYNRGLAHLQLGRFQDAIEDSSAALRRDERYVQAFYNRGLARLKLEERDAALEDFRSVAALDPGHLQAWSHLAQLYSTDADRHAEAIEAWTRLTELEPANPQAWFSRAALHFGRGQAREARDDFAAVIELVPRAPDPYRNRAIINLVALRDLEASLADWRRLSELQPASHEPFYYIGVIHLGRREFDDARRALEEAVRLNADSVEAHWALAQVDLWAGRPEAGLERIAAVHDRVAADRPEAFTVRGEAFRLLGRTEEAMADFRRVVESGTPSAETAVNAACSLASLCLRRDGRDAARACHDAVVAAYPESLKARLARAAFLRGQSELAAAREDCRAAAALDPDSILPGLVEAGITAAAGDPDAAAAEAQSLLEQAAEGNGQVLYAAACVWSLAAEAAGQESETGRLYTDRAADFLSETLDRGFHDLLYAEHNRMAEDPALDPVRAHPRVASLLQHLPQPPAPPSPSSPL